MPDLNARVQPILDDLIGRDVECGLQVAAYIDGELVVDAWAGLADASTGRPVDGDTLFCLFSVTKGLTATAMHLLAERGQIDYDRPIAHYWPEFGRNGKQQMTVRHILSHTAGVPHMPDGIGLVDTYDWDRICQAITTLAPLWEPGTAAGYHTMTFGWILGEIARRVDGRSIATFVREELCQPLGITDLYFGIPDAVEPRVARLEGGELPPLPSDALLLRALPAWIFPMGETANQPGFRRAGLPWGGGIMNARSLARFYAALADAHPAGQRLLSAEGIQVATALQSADIDQVMGGPRNRALGYHLGEPLSPMGAGLSAFGHDGAGGSIGFADPQHRFAFGLAKTRMVFAPPEEEAAYLVAREIRRVVGIPEAG